jgi:transposase InsO family protein
LPHLAKEQGKEKALRAKAIAQPNVYTKKTIHHGDKSYEIVMKNEKIVVPKTLQKRAVEWYHGILMHPGEQRTEFTMAQHYTWKGMRSTIQSVCKRCVSCQLTKPKSKKYGHLPPKDAEAIPWDTLCIDLIGPYQIGAGRNGLTLHCLTMIDPATGWFEIAEIPNKRADEVSNILEQAWLVRYPWPTKVVMDRGREFMGEVRDMLKDDYGIVRKPITTRNPQANAMVERAHQTIHNLIRSQQIRGKSDLVGGDWSGLLSAVGFAMRATVHATARATPSQLVFGRDAMLNVGFEADWQYIKERKQRLIVQNNKRENATRLPHVYSVGDQVLVATDPNRKHGEDRYKGPFEVTAVNDNGTLTLRQDTPRGGAVLQTWNLRNIVPYKA